MRDHRPNRSGFTLVELAAASILLGAGLFVTLGLLRRGLDLRSDNEAETRGALFAESAFATLRAASSYAAWSGGTNGWCQFWASFASGTNGLPLRSAAGWPAEGEYADDDPLAAHYLFGKNNSDGDRPCLYLETAVDWNSPTLAPETAETDSAAPGQAAVWYRLTLPDSLDGNASDIVFSDVRSIPVSLLVWPAKQTASAISYYSVFSYEGPYSPAVPNE